MNSGFPNLRFLGFEGEWEEKKLGNVCDINPKNESLPNTFIYIDLESVVDGSLQKENTVLKEEAPSRAQRILIKNDILFQMVRPYQKNNLFFDKDGDFVASTGYAQIRTKENSQFIFQYLHNQNFVDKVIERCTGTSYPAINSSDLGKIQIAIPKLEEQKKIGDFLNLISQRILSQKKIIEQIKTLMKGSLEQIFSQKLRFKDENGNHFSDWRVEYLGNVSTITTGSSNRADSILDGDYTFFDRSQDIRTSSQYLFDKEAIIIPGEGQEFIPKYFVGKFDLHQRTYAIFDFLNINGKFLYYQILSDDRHLQSQAVGSTVKSLRLPMFQSMPIKLPSLKEQIKIVNFLSSIQEKIETEKQILEKLELQKKFLLSNLFV